MNPERQESKSIAQFMTDMKVGRSKLTHALEELGFLQLPVVSLGYNDARMLSPEVQQQVIEQLRIIHPDAIDAYHQNGYRSPSQLKKLLKVSKATTFRYLDAVAPTWRDEPTMPKGQRRITLLAPEIVTNVKRYHNLRDERQLLATWRSMRTRGTLSQYHHGQLEDFYHTNYAFLERIFVDHEPLAMETYTKLPTALPALTEREFIDIKKSIAWTRIAKTIQASADIIPLHDDDVDMFQKFFDASELAVVRLVLTHLHIPLGLKVIQVKKEGALAYNTAIAKRFVAMCKEIVPLIQACDTVSDFEDALDNL